MVFSSAVFLFLFLPITVLVYYSPLCKAVRAKNGWLLLVSLGFYAWGEPIYILLMLLSIAVNYVLGRCAEKTARTAQGRTVVVIACVYNLGVLFVFKYTAWILRDVLQYDVTRTPFASLALPIGISFYTFQTLSYVIDVYRGSQKAQRNLLDAGLYIAFFPQLIAGPIVRYGTVSAMLLERTHRFSDFSEGTRRFIIGLSKKLLIANNVAPVVYHAFNAGAAERSVLFAWGGAFAFTLQIYFDFSGYSDMAIGLGKMFGFTFSENFNYPYIAASVREFWRRWHISLSSWFREYLYIPLGGNRKGKYRTYLHLLIVFAATGLWHGASWNFVGWGLYHGAFMLLERVGFCRFLDREGAGYRLLGHLYTLFVVVTGWVFFRAESLGSAVSFLARMLCLQAPSHAPLPFGVYVGTQGLLAFLLGVLGCGVIQSLFGKRLIRYKNGLAEAVYLALVLFYCIVLLANQSYNPFIYFRF